MYPTITFFRDKDGEHYAATGIACRNRDLFVTRTATMLAEMGIAEYAVINKAEAIRQAIVSGLIVEINEKNTVLLRGAKDIDIWLEERQPDGDGFWRIRYVDPEDDDGGIVEGREGNPTAFAESLEEEFEIVPIQAIAVKELTLAGFKVSIRGLITRPGLVKNLLKGSGMVEKGPVRWTRQTSANSQAN